MNRTTTTTTKRTKKTLSLRKKMPSGTASGAARAPSERPRRPWYCVEGGLGSGFVGCKKGKSEAGRKECGEGETSFFLFRSRRREQARG